MKIVRIAVLVCSVAAACSGQGLPIEPKKMAGDSVSPVFEGWFRNSDGTFSLLFGYFNRNRGQAIDVPVGAGNRIEPGGPDQGQPTHFVPGRGWGMFTIKVPADFGDKKMLWTLVTNGETIAVPGTLHVDYELAPFSDAGGNSAPILGFDEKGQTAQGPQPLSVSRTAKVGAPLALSAWITDDGKVNRTSGGRPREGTPPITLRWIQYRGPGPVTFREERPAAEKIEWRGPDSKFTGKSTTTATFSQPGEYVLNLSVNDYSGEGGSGFQCCWTTGKVKVSVGP